jgi:ATP-dependent protease HslVU (ClpYQ) peptidase subunit
VTTAVYDGHSMAADGRTTWGTEIARDDSVKVRAISYDGRNFVITHAGREIESYDLLRHWVYYTRHGRTSPHQTRPAAEVGDGRYGFIIAEIHEDGSHTAYLVSANSDFVDVTGTAQALGSGGDFAKGAMQAGATAREAVKVGIKNDSASGGKITVISLNPPPKRFSQLEDYEDAKQPTSE